MHHAYSRVALMASAVALSSAFLSTGIASAQDMPSFGDLIKLQSDNNQETNIDSPVYYYGADGKRYVFPNEKTYKSWYVDFSNVKTVTAEQLQAIPMGGNVTYRPGTRLVKIVSDDKVYAVSKNGVLRPLAGEAVAVAIFGPDWKSEVDDLSSAFFENYTLGKEIALASDYDRINSRNDVATISADKLLTPAIAADVNQTVSFSPATASN